MYVVIMGQRRFLGNFRLILRSLMVLMIIYVINMYFTATSLRFKYDYHSKPIKIGEQEYYYVCPLLTGGTGNSMFVYASVYGIAAATGRKIIMSFNNLDYVFKNIEGNVSQVHCDFLPIAHSKRHCSYDPGMLNLQPNKNFRVGDYLQSYKYFESYENDIRELFTFQDDVKNASDTFLQQVADDYNQARNQSIVTSPVTFIGVHIRRGDMIAKMYSNYGYNVPNETYIDRAMQYMETYYNNVVYIIASNDLRWAKSKFNGSNIYFSNLNDSSHDLALLASCNHSITTIGTFGWWSAYLAGGTTLYYKYPAKEGSDLRQQFSSDYSDFFMPHWIGLS